MVVSPLMRRALLRRRRAGGSSCSERRAARVLSGLERGGAAARDCAAATRCCSWHRARRCRLALRGPFSLSRERPRGSAVSLPQSGDAGGSASMSEVGFKPVDATERPTVGRRVCVSLGAFGNCRGGASGRRGAGCPKLAWEGATILERPPRPMGCRRLWTGATGVALRKGASPMAFWPTGALVLSVLSFLGNAAEGARV